MTSCKSYFWNESSLTNLATWFISRSSQFLTAWTSPQGLLECPHDTAASFSQSGGSKRQQDTSYIFYDLASEVILHHLSNILLATQIIHIECERELHRHVNARRWEQWRASLEAGYHSRKYQSVKQESFPRNMHIAISTTWTGRNSGANVINAHII